MPELARGGGLAAALGAQLPLCLQPHRDVDPPPRRRRTRRYWARQMRQPVRFAAGAGDPASRTGAPCSWRWGRTRRSPRWPRLHLRGTRARCRRCPRCAARAARPRSTRRCCEALGDAVAARAWRWTGRRFYAHERRLRLSLPTYPFERAALLARAAGCSRRGSGSGRAPAALPRSGPAPAPAAGAAPHAAAAAEDLPRRDDRASSVMAIWRERLGVEDIGIARQLPGAGRQLADGGADAHAACARPSRSQLPLSDLFEAPTVAGIAERIEALLQVARPRGADAACLRLVPVPRDGELPLSFVQERVCALEQFAARPVRPTTCPSSCGWRARWTWPCWSAASRRSSAATRRCAPPTTRWTAAPCSASTPRVHVPLEVLVLERHRARSARPRRCAWRRGRGTALRPGEGARAAHHRWCGCAPDVHLCSSPSTTSSPTRCPWWSSSTRWRRSTRRFRQGRPSPLPALPVQYADFGGVAAARAGRRGPSHRAAAVVARAARRHAAARWTCPRTGPGPRACALTSARTPWTSLPPARRRQLVRSASARASPPS